MKAGKNKMVSENMRSCIIRVEGYDNKNLQGIFYNLYYGTEVVFESLTKLLLLMEELMDELDCPQASLKGKRFDIAYKVPERSNISLVSSKSDRDALATFRIKVLFRQGASWQGTIEWLEEKLETSFRSVLELIKLMDSALPQPQDCCLLGLDEAEAM